MCINDTSSITLVRASVALYSLSTCKYLKLGSASLSSGLGATGVSINPSVVTPTLPSGHFDPAPSSSGAEVVKPLVNFGAMAWVVIAGIAGGALIL